MKYYAKLRNTFCLFVFYQFNAVILAHFLSLYGQNILQNVYATPKKDWIRMMSVRK